MREDIKNQWVAALRSGQYPQARECMKDSQGGRCCLGVLEEVVLGLPLFKGQMLLSTAAVAAAGLNHDDAGVHAYGRDNFHPPSLNDGNPHLGRAPMSFAEIADQIELHWKEM